MSYLPEAQKTPWQQSDEINLSTTAVLVIDVLGGKGGPTPGLEDMAANCVAVVKAARAKGMPVVFACDAHIPGLDKELELWGEHGIAGTDAAQPLAAFDVCDQDYVIPKRRYNGFYQTDLELTLRELGTDTLIAIGCDTNICVLQTLAGAYYAGFKTVVPADATATFLVGTQEAGLEYFTKCYDTRVVSTETVLDYLA
ncbi:MAG: isochorismatase family cysteine hydrolase [Coriobacteriia bacterium]|nr:isochorismatase family cysteine hydrolase [Coriobacteriia bacterium]